MTDIMYNPEIVHKAGVILASAFNELTYRLCSNS